MMHRLSDCILVSNYVNGSLAALKNIITNIETTGDEKMHQENYLVITFFRDVHNFVC